jgi:hypothetical protein
MTHNSATCHLRAGASGAWIGSGRLARSVSITRSGPLDLRKEGEARKRNRHRPPVSTAPPVVRVCPGISMSRLGVSYLAGSPPGQTRPIVTIDNFRLIITYYIAGANSLSGAIDSRRQQQKSEAAQAGRPSLVAGFPHGRSSLSLPF